MAELLDRIHAEIRERLETSRAAVQEYEMLQAALTALGGPEPEGESSKTSSASKPSAPKRRTRSVARKSGGARAPRGANREAVRRVLGERPGVGASELAVASGVKRPVLYALLARLVEVGEVVKATLPGDSTGYSLPRSAATHSSARPQAPGESLPSVPAVGETPTPGE